MSELRIVEDDGWWMVWLNPDHQEYSGLCIGGAHTRDEAVAIAVKDLEAVLEQLQQPALPTICQCGVLTGGARDTREHCPLRGLGTEPVTSRHREGN